VFAKEGMEAAQDFGARGRGIVIDSPSVCCPYGMECHCMTSLKTITIRPAQEPRTARRPRKESLRERDRMRKMENALKLCPHSASKRTGKEEVVKVLNGGTMMA